MTRSTDAPHVSGCAGATPWAGKVQLSKVATATASVGARASSAVTALAATVAQVERSAGSAIRATPYTPPGRRSCEAAYRTPGAAPGVSAETSKVRPERTVTVGASSPFPMASRETSTTTSRPPGYPTTKRPRPTATPPAPSGTATDVIARTSPSVGSAAFSASRIVGRPVQVSTSWSVLEPAAMTASASGRSCAFREVSSCRSAEASHIGRPEDGTESGKTSPGDSTTALSVASMSRSSSPRWLATAR